MPVPAPLPCLPLPLFSLAGCLALSLLPTAACHPHPLFLPVAYFPTLCTFLPYTPAAALLWGSQQQCGPSLALSQPIQRETAAVLVWAGFWLERLELEQKVRGEGAAWGRGSRGWEWRGKGWGTDTGMVGKGSGLRLQVPSHPTLQSPLHFPLATCPLPHQSSHPA